MLSCGLTNDTGMGQDPPLDAPKGTPRLHSFDNSILLEVEMKDTCETCRLFEWIEEYGSGACKYVAPPLIAGFLRQTGHGSRLSSYTFVDKNDSCSEHKPKEGKTND